MGFKQILKMYPKAYESLLKVLGGVDYFNKRFRKKYPDYSLDDSWEKRIEIVKSSNDNSRINVVKDAGKVFHDYQLMHNGLKISLGSYYNYGNTRLLVENNGVHEPQEEFVFQEVLKGMRKGATMMELGSYWAFYSLWFNKEVENAQCFMVEPDPHKMNFGKLNFKLNNFKGVFDYGFISDEPILKNRIPTLSVDFLVKKHKIEFLDVLHSDIQGYELKMLQGAKETLASDKVGYVFISTHSQQLHSDCIKELKKYDLDILCEADLEETYSWDGLIVGKFRNYEGISSIDISKRRQTVSVN